MNFIIIAPARSGSTLLRNLLNKHPQICCHGEVFAENRVFSFSRKKNIHRLTLREAFNLRQANKLNFFNKYVVPTSIAVSGFKLLYTQLFNLDFAPVLNAILESKDFRVILLWRRNLIARYISQVRLKMKVGKTTTRSKRRDGYLNSAMLPLEVERSCLINIAARDWAKIVFHGHPSIEICYEDLISAYAVESERLCEFLGVDPNLMPKLPAKPEGAGVRSDNIKCQNDGRLKEFWDYK